MVVGAAGVPPPDYKFFVFHGKVGMVAEVSITGSEKRDMTLVPLEAVVRDAQGATVVFQYYPDQHRVYSKDILLPP